MMASVQSVVRDLTCPGVRPRFSLSRRVWMLLDFGVKGRGFCNRKKLLDFDFFFLNLFLR